MVFTTFADEAAAASVVRTLVAEDLAACGTIVPGARSIYRWKDKIEDAPEVVVIFKTTEAAYSAFESRLQALHPYETPEIIALGPAAVGESYARWVEGCCGL